MSNLIFGVYASGKRFLQKWRYVSFYEISAEGMRVSDSRKGLKNFARKVEKTISFKGFDIVTEVQREYNIAAAGPN